MARFVDSVPSSWSPEDAFSYMADARNFAEWDPGTERVAQVQGSGPAPDAAYDVTLRVGSRTTTFRYDVVEWQPPRRVVLAASNAVMHLHDEVVIDRIEMETLITYDARISLRGPLEVFDCWLDRRFRTMGERAAAGLRERVRRPR